MKSAKRYGFYLHSDLVVALECAFTMRIIYWQNLLRPVSFLWYLLVATGRFFARLQYTRVARARVVEISPVALKESLPVQ